MRLRDYVRHLAATALLFMSLTLPAAAQGRPDGVAVMRVWYDLTLDLIRHTPTYTPPVASRALGYVGITAFEVTASGDVGLTSLQGQLNGLGTLPSRPDGPILDEALTLHAALAVVVAELFANTGPTGQRALAAVTGKLGARLTDGLDPEVAAASAAYGQNLAAALLDWARTDGGAVIENQGFPSAYVAASGPAAWVPTSRVVLQQAPLLPEWGNKRPFAMPDGAACALPPPPAYSEDAGSAFYAEGQEVYDTVLNLTPEQRAIALFWADDAMLSKTPPGHWVAIALQELEAEGADQARQAEVMARLGIGLSDAFIACWNAKFEYDLLRPVTYIRRVIDPAWEPVLITPPFPEYPSGHSTQSGAAAAVLTQMFGPDHAFVDATGQKDGHASRAFASFAAAAQEAGISRLYGGIHFRAAIERGLAQGECVAAHVASLRTRP